MIGVGVKTGRSGGSLIGERLTGDGGKRQSRCGLAMGGGINGAQTGAISGHKDIGQSRADQAGALGHVTAKVGADRQLAAKNIE